MKRRLHLAVVVASVLLLSGCVEIGSVLTVNRDGSAVIEETTLLGAQLSALMAMGTAQAGRGGAAAPDTPTLVMSRDKAEAKAKAMGPGVTVRSLEDLKMPDGRQGQKVVYAIANIGNVKYEVGDMNTTTANGTPSVPIVFTFNNGMLTIRNPRSQPTPAAQAPAGSPTAGATPGAMSTMPTEQELAMVKSLVTGMRVSMFVKAASGIASTDATYVDGDTVTLYDVQVDKLLDNPAVMAKFSAMSDGTTPAQAAEALKDVPGVRAELKESITIRLK